MPITNLPSRYALILDHDTIESVLKKIARCNLPRRKCHPLDRYSGKRVAMDVARYDEEVEATTTIEDDYVEDPQPTLHAAEDYLVEDSQLEDEIDFDCVDEEDDKY